ncbi:MAG TPA: ABC transporter permease [Candidatus Corynebacterium gallistercoris]|uniref:ABC transporter permease n=1 Tax=Candidatus Corynebacterium gallistercoris TaxID=2838530 RepID=A0A9D1RXY2_9CORY|nr:ABC transporter permease [Candidatus Corynebacterium gallistercoris]
MLNVIRSESIKLRSTKAIWWTSALIVLFSLAWALLMGLASSSGIKSAQESNDPELYASLVAGVNNDGALAGYLFFGLMVVMIQGVMLVTSEYGTNTSKTTLLATPTRWQVPLAKYVVYGVIASVLSLISAVGSILMFRWSLSWGLDDEELLSRVSFSGDAWTVIGLIVLYTVLTVGVAIGVGYLVRHTAGAIATLLLWNLVIEGALVPMLPKVRDWLPPYMPFNNATHAVRLNDVADAPWGHTGSMVYFAAWALVIFLAGLIVLKKRDA